MTTNSKSFTLSQMVMACIFSLLVGGVLSFFLCPLFVNNSATEKTSSQKLLTDTKQGDDPQIDSVTFDKMGIGRIKKNKSIQARFGGPTTGKHAEDLAFAYSAFLKEHTQNSSEFSTFYSAAAWYTAEELTNYIDVITTKAGTTVSPKDIRIYFCPGVYPNFTTNPHTKKDVSFRITSCLVALKTPYRLINTNGTLNIENNPNSLGVYNWGDLEP